MKQNEKSNFFLAIFTIIPFISFSQQAPCSVTISPNPVTIYCGESVNLSASGVSGNYVMNNDFNDGTPGTGWTASPAAQFNNPCEPSLDGTTYMWMGSTTAAPRELQTAPFNFACGGQICFEMDYATQGDPSPCEGPDLPNEGVYLQYSTDGGAT